jgi:hypothetical protein
MATAVTQQTASAEAHETATAIAQQTATAADQQTAIAAAEQTATAVAQQTVAVAAQQTATAAAQQRATAVAQQTAIAAAEQTATAAAEQTAIAAAEQTATVEPGDPDSLTLSLHTQTDVLSARVQDPGVLSRVAGRAHVALSQVQRVSTAVDPQKPLITIQVLSTTPRAVAAVAQGLAQYLAGMETQQVQAQVASLSRTAARAMAQAQQRWQEAQAYYYLVCNCLAGQHQAQLRTPPTPQRTARPLRPRPPQQLHRQPADPATLAQLRAELDLLQADYVAAASRYAALRNNPVPVATVLPGSVSAVQAPAASPLRAVLLATVVGLVLSSGLAMLLDSRRSGLPALGRARGPGHAARRDPEPAATLWRGSARPLKAVLLAAGLGLLACIGLAALLLDGWTVPLSVASHVGARRVRLEERRWPQAAQPTGPLTALPAPPALLLNPDAVHFNRHDGRARRTAQTIYVVNVGPAPVTIRTITITGADRAAFAEADTCTRSAVGMYGRCTISVRVAPLAGGGPRKATLVITANAPGSPQRVPLSA